MATKPLSAEFLAQLEGEATPFAAAPRLMNRERAGFGDQAVAISSIRRVVIDALLSAGYELGLAERIAEETANLVPAIEQKLHTSG